MKRYRFYLDSDKDVFYEFTEEKFKKFPEIAGIIDGEKIKCKKLIVDGYKNIYAIITPIENFEVQEYAR